ncbi:MAG: 50S ribosomal protein P1 [Candidatus Bathyarchaeia archaeon]|jgi:large subunit ribosomal protein L12
MEYVYAALLLHSAGGKITEDTVKKVLTAAGVKTDEPRVKALVAALSEIKIDDALKAAQAIPVAAAPAAAAPTGGKKDKKEGAEDEKKKGEEALAGLGALFG